MRRLSRFTYTIFVMLGTAVLMTGGFAYGFSKTSSKKFFSEAEEIRLAKEKEQEEKMQEDIAVNAKLNEEIENAEPEEIIESVSDIEVTYVDEYTKCNHTVVTKVNVFGTTIEQLKLKLANDSSKKDYTLVEETNKSLTYKRVIKGYCPDHYSVEIDKNEVVIYQLEGDSKIEYQRLNVPIEKLDETLLKQLKEGIQLDTKEKLYSLIEVIES